MQTGGIINISDKKHENLAGSFNLSMNMIPCGPTPAEESKHSAHIVKEENNEEEEEEIKIQQVKATG